MRHIWKILAAVAVLALLAIAITQPRKSLRVSAMWTAPFPDYLKTDPHYRPGIHDRESVTYRVYYAWDGKTDRLPWWIITRSLDGTWRVIEPANSDNYNTQTDSVPFDERWAKGGFHRVARTRYEKIRHVILDTDNFARERRALSHVLELVEVQEDCEATGGDVFDTMKKYISEHPRAASFFPEDRAYWEDRYKKMEPLYRAARNQETETGPHNKRVEATQ